MLSRLGFQLNKWKQLSMNVQSVTHFRIPGVCNLFVMIVFIDLQYVACPDSVNYEITASPFNAIYACIVYHFPYYAKSIRIYSLVG